MTSGGIDWQREKWQSGLGSKFIHQGEKNAAKYADEVIVLSKGVQDYFKETYGRKTHFIPNGVNRPQTREAKLITDKFGLKKDSYILFLGRLVPEKGIRYLVEAFKNVKTDKKLVIAGGSSDTDSFMTELKELAKDDNRILFTGFVQGAMLDELYSNAYIYTLPSDLEGIADRLNAKKVPSPAARKLQSGAKLSLHFRKSDEPPWSAKAVDRILHNEVYIGKLVQGKTRRLDYRSKKKMNVPMRDWVIVDNTHEAIIPAEQFELVQRILETETRRPNDAETVALFAGFLYCGDCGSRLVRRSASYNGKRYIYYQCSGSKQNKGSCTSHNLRDEKLYNIVRNALQMQIQIVMEEAEFVESVRQARQEPYRVRRIERQIRQLTAEKAHTQGIKEKLYGDYADEILTREDFLNYNELYSKRIEEYDHKITELEAERQNLQNAPNAYPFLDVYRKYRKLEEITRPMVVELIEKIEV